MQKIFSALNSRSIPEDYSEITILQGILSGIITSHRLFGQIK